MCGEDWILLDYFKIVSIFRADRYVLASLPIVSFSGISAVFFSCTERFRSISFRALCACLSTVASFLIFIYQALKVSSCLG